MKIIKKYGRSEGNLLWGSASTHVRDHHSVTVHGIKKIKNGEDIYLTGIVYVNGEARQVYSNPQNNKQRRTWFN